MSKSGSPVSPVRRGRRDWPSRIRAGDGATSASTDGILVEPDSREPWFVSRAHKVDFLGETLDKFERAVDITLQGMPGRQTRNA